MVTPTFIKSKDTLPCIVLIGMAGAGKTTVSGLLAQKISWVLADTDHIIEATYGTSLQNIADALTKDDFLDTESFCVQKLRLNRAVIATGGSVIYRDEAMKHLANLGHIVFLDVKLETILERIAKNPDRGLAIAPGQTIEDLFKEREALYSKYAHYRVDANGKTPDECVEEIIKLLPNNLFEKENC